MPVYASAATPDADAEETVSACLSAAASGTTAASGAAAVEAARTLEAVRLSEAVDCARTGAGLGAAVVFTTGRSKETVAVGAAVTARADCADPDSVDAETPAVVSAAVAGRPMLRM